MVTDQAFAAVDGRFLALLEKYRRQYLNFLLMRFDATGCPEYRGGFFNINSVSGEPYPHRRCYTWTDGRSLGEMSIAHLAGLGDRHRLRAYADHLAECLLERYRLNGYLPHSVDDRTNLAADDALNVAIGAGQSSYSHVFAMNGLYQYALVFGSSQTKELADRLFSELEAALLADSFLEAAAPRPAGERSQGPFMISLGACADALETLAALGGPDDPKRWLSLGSRCVAHITANHHDPISGRFWEVSHGGAPVRRGDGVTVTDPGHTIEFAGFGARFARFLRDCEGTELTATCAEILAWATGKGFHATKPLIYKNVDCETGAPLQDAEVANVSRRVDEKTWREHFGATRNTVMLATFPWWVPMETMATASMVRGIDPRADAILLRAARGIFAHFRNPRIGGLCYQSIGDGFFGPIDIQPATPTLDLMHSHRSLRIVARELAGVAT